MKSNEQNKDVKDVKETVTASFDIPSRIYLFGRRPVGETKEIVSEHLRNQAMSICDLLAYGAACVQSGNFDEKIFIDSVGTLANIASNHIEAIEIVERDKDGELARASLPAVKAAPTAEDSGAEEYFTARINQTLDEIGQQLEIALTSNKTSDGVKDCLKTIIYEASNEANLALSDLTLIRAAFPNIIKSLPINFGRGVSHSLQSILRLNTGAFQEFYDQQSDEKPTNANLKTIAEQIANLLKNPLLPDKLYNAIADEVSDIPDIHTPDNVLQSLNKMARSKQ